MSQYNKLYTAQDSAVVFIDHQSLRSRSNSIWRKPYDLELNVRWS